MDLVVDAGADCDRTTLLSKGSSREFESWTEGDVFLCAKKDPIAGAWLFDRDLADLIKSQTKILFFKLRQKKEHI